MDALDYEKLLTNGYDSKGTRLDRERLTVLEEDVRAVAQELEEGSPTVRRIDSVRKRVLISHDVQHGGQRGVGDATNGRQRSARLLGCAMTAIIPGDPRCHSDA